MRRLFGEFVELHAAVFSALRGRRTVRRATISTRRAGRRRASQACGEHAADLGLDVARDGLSSAAQRAKTAAVNCRSAEEATTSRWRRKRRAEEGLRQDLWLPDERL